jgi:uncharacterized membrane protein YfcA
MRALRKHYALAAWLCSEFRHAPVSLRHIELAERVTVTSTDIPSVAVHRTIPLALLCGAVIGTLGGLIGLGGAEFRLPLLIGLFGFAALEAVIINKATSLIVVTSALIFRSQAVPVAQVLAHGNVILTLLAGSLLGAWFGADLATRLSARTLYRVIAILLVGIAAVLLLTHDASAPSSPMFSGPLLTTAGIGAGFIIGVVASFLGVAGGELLIPTLVLLFGLEIKLAGSVSLAVSLPTMIVGFARYSRDRSFAILARYPRFVVAMGLGSIVGALAGGLLLGVVPGAVLLPLLAAILLISAYKVWRHQ